MEENLQEDNEFFDVKNSENFGRYLVAKQDIPARTLILKECPLIHAPADEHDSDNEKSASALLFCLGCCIHLKKEMESFSCPQCGWPQCSKICTSSLGLHQENECRIFQENQATFPPPHEWPILYKSILVLRIILLVKDKNPLIWDEFFALLEHHNDIRKKKDHCIQLDKMILENLRYFFKASLNDNIIVSLLKDEDFIRRIIGIINVNAFCANKGSEEFCNVRKAKSVFQKASLFAHSCAPNCSWAIDLNAGDGFIPKIKVYTAIPVKKYDLITIPYNTRHLFYGTLKRQLLIESVAHFVCKCIRCQDPTELGTFMSAIRCFKCDEGFLIPQNPSCQDSVWVCKNQDCSKSQHVAKVVFFVTEIEDQLDVIQNQGLSKNKEVEKLQKLFQKHYDVLLHKNHYTLQEISTRILELLVEWLEDAPLELIELFLWHCQHLIQIADVILPGFNGYRDQLLDYQTEALYHKCRVLEEVKSA